MQWMGDVLASVNEATEVEELLQKLQSGAVSLGFEYCAYGLQTLLPVTRPRIYTQSTYPTAWCEHYQRAGYLAIDPSVQHCQRSQAPVLWSEGVFSAVPRLWDDAQQVGLRVGWAQSCLDACGGGGMFTLARSADALGESELRSHEVKMRWLTSLAHQGFARLMSPSWQPQLCSPLSSREREVLRWAADGKTLAQVADILTLSMETVKFHTRNAGVKLGAANRTAAVARAALLGLLSWVD